jgi:NAD(P)-dependent dehydrogenase (short-subunit alcohol dehydrogenase family)
MNKKYVVNGAANPGFGETTARLLISKGNKVFGFYEQSNEKNAELLLKEFDNKSLELICIDNSNLESIREKIKLIPENIDGFVNANFFFAIEDVGDFDYDLSERIFRENYFAPMLMSIELKKKMRKGSAIVIVTSTESERGSYGGISYAASKAAVHNLIKSLACNWGKDDQIRVNAVAAGWVGGEMDTDGPFSVSINITPLGRLGRPEDISNTIYFLLSEQSAFINAQAIFVDGGYLAVDDIAKFEYEEMKKK